MLSAVLFNKNYLCDLIDSSDKPVMTSQVATADFRLHYGDSRQTRRFRIVRGLRNGS